MKPCKPTRVELLAARGKTVADIIAPRLDVLFVGINPSLYSAAVGHHFARPGNRFWPVLFAAGFTKRLLSPFDERELLNCGYGISNLVRHASASAAELSPAEFAAGGRRLIAKVRRYRPRIVAVLGIGAYRVAFSCTKAVLGKQQDTVGGTCAWVLPNPSGLNANYRLADLTRLYRQLRRAAERAT